MKTPKIPKMPKELKSKVQKKADKLSKAGKPSAHVPSFDPITRTRDMAREAINEGQFGAKMMMEGK